MKNSGKFPLNGAVKISRGLVLLAIALLLSQGRVGAQAVNVLTQHNDLSRTGANTSESILTPANVSASFRKLFTDDVDGQV
jgi:hypothetical protein